MGRPFLSAPARLNGGAAGDGAVIDAAERGGGPQRLTSHAHAWSPCRASSSATRVSTRSAKRIASAASFSAMILL